MCIYSELTSLQTETKESKWDMPDELLLLLEKVEKENKAAQQAYVDILPPLLIQILTEDGIAQIHA